MKTDTKKTGSQTSLTEPPAPGENAAAGKPKLRVLAVSPEQDGFQVRLAELTEPDPEHPGKSHALKIIAGENSSVFMVNHDDLEQVMITANAVVGLQNVEWLEVMTRAARIRAGEAVPKEGAEIAKGFAEGNKAEEEAAAK